MGDCTWSTGAQKEMPWKLSSIAQSACLQLPAKHCKLPWCMDKVPFTCIIKISTKLQLLKKVLFKNRPAQAGQLNNFTFVASSLLHQNSQRKLCKIQKLFEVQIISISTYKK